MFIAEPMTMSPREKDASSYLELVEAVYLDASARCSADVSDLRDLMTIRKRVEKEGASFLTLTLPGFAKDLERALADGCVGPSLFRGFEFTRISRRKRGAIPAFLQGMLGRLFDRETGRILDETQDPHLLVEAVRQVCLSFKKVEVECSPEREKLAVDNFVNVERLNQMFVVSDADRDIFLEVSRAIWPFVLGDLSPSALVPRHGPGATAERISGNGKYVWRRWHDRLDRVFPLVPYGLSSSTALEGYGRDLLTGSFQPENRSLREVTFVPPEQEQPVRVTLVPKTLKGPRIIAIEPVCMQYAQQALQSELYSRIERHRFTRGRVNFRDQSLNQNLALTSSRTGSLATIDLSDASDRVLYSLALRMFDSHPEIQEIVDACRSTRAELPDGRVIGPLVKFASMGSALCFPVEAMYFYTSCVVALLRKQNLPVTPANCFHVGKVVSIYGDDIIVPTDDAEVVLDHLRRYNCKVNDSKSFWTGKFRESCGVDAYNGQVVTPIYIRKPCPEDKRQVSSLVSWVATANLFLKKGYVRTASYMFCTCEKFLGRLPEVNEESPILGRVSTLGLNPPVRRWDKSSQSFQERGWVPSPVYCCDELDGYPALQKCLLRLESKDRSDDPFSWLNPGPLLKALTGSSVWESYSRGLPLVDRDFPHLSFTAVRGALTLKRRWVPST